MSNQSFTKSEHLGVRGPLTDEEQDGQRGTDAIAQDMFEYHSEKAEDHSAAPLKPNVLPMTQRMGPAGLEATGYEELNQS